MASHKHILPLVLLISTTLCSGCGSEPDPVSPPLPATSRVKPVKKLPRPPRPEKSLSERTLEAVFKREAEKRRARAEWLESIQKMAEQNKKKKE